MALPITRQLIWQAIGLKQPFLSILAIDQIPVEVDTLVLTSNISIWVVVAAHLAQEEIVVALVITPNKGSQGLMQLRWIIRLLSNRDMPHRVISSLWRRQQPEQLKTMPWRLINVEIVHHAFLEIIRLNGHSYIRIIRTLVEVQHQTLQWVGVVAA